MFYSTLDEALTDIAGRSFTDDATVTPVEGGYTVEDDYGTAFAGDEILWSYAGGMELPEGVTDHSRLHDPAEYYADAAHIRYNLETAVEALEAGKAVTFAYAVVDAYPESDEEMADDEAGLYDATVGWALLAF